MTWITLDAPMLCVSCRTEQPTGSEMAQYQLGPVIRVHRCSQCFYGHAQKMATIDRQKEANFRTVPDNATTDEAVSIHRAYSEGFAGGRGPVSVGSMRAPRIKKFSDLPESVQQAQERIAGNR